MKKIAIVTTGGTIAAKSNGEGKLVSGIMSGEELVEKCQLPNDIIVEIFNVFNLPSMHIGIQQMNILKNKVLELMNTNQFDGIVITHGTDSLEETSYFLDLTVETKIPVVLTGSQRSVEQVGSDVYVNLKNSILVASEPISNEMRILIVFNERIWSAKHIKKVHSSNIQGFQTFGYGYLGIIDNDKVKFFQRPIQNNKVIDIENINCNVQLIKSYSGADGYLIDCLNDEVNGLIVEGVGRGQISPEMSKSLLTKMNSLNIPVIITTSAEEGYVYESYHYEGSASHLKDEGCILGGELDSKKARIKLSLLLSKYDTVTQELFDSY